MTETTKTCTKCGEAKPATTDFFFNAKDGKFGLRGDCKLCLKKIQKKRYIENQEIISEKNKKYRLKNIELVKERQKNWRTKNREVLSEQRKKYRLENLELIKERKKKYYLENRELIKERKKKYYLENREVFAEQRKKYRLKNPDVARRSNAKRRALKKHSNGHSPYTEAEVLNLYGTDCHLCGQPIDFEAPRHVRYIGWELGLQIDHVIPISKGGPDSLENVKPAHGKCNLSKNNRTLN